MSIVVTSTVICDAVYGGQICGVSMKVEGNAVKAVREAREVGWDVRRHAARCPICIPKQPLPPEDAAE